MWQWLMLILVALVLVKFLNLYFFWSSKGVTYENYIRYLYRVLIMFNKRPVYDVIRDDVKSYGRIYGSYRGIRPSLVIADTNIAKDVMIKQFGNFFKRSFEFTAGDPLWDNSVSHLPYDQWKSVRNVMSNTFTSSKMKSMIPKLDKVAKRLTSKLEAIAKSRDNKIVMTPYLEGYGMDSLAAISFGIDLNCIEDMDNEIVRHAAEIFRPGVTSIILAIVPGLIKYLPFVDFPPKATSKFFGELGKHVLEEKRKKLDDVIKNNTADIIDHHLIAQRDDKSGLTDDVLASQAFIFFIGGLDTSVFTLDFATYFLAVNPDVQDKVYNNIKAVMGDREDVTYDDLQKMPLLEACSLESLRLMPQFFYIDRICTKDTTVAGVKISKGMLIEFPLPFIHYDPLYFPEPEKFNPERFLKGGELSSGIGSFLSFGDGPKNCVGKRLALMNISVLLANMFFKMKFERTEMTPVPLRLRNGIRFKDISQDPLYIGLTPRSS